MFETDHKRTDGIDGNAATVNERIEHSGIVDRVEGDTVFVRITSHSACGACRAREACGMSEAQEKIVAVRSAAAATFAPGDPVEVGVLRSMGMRAVALAYVGALVVLLAVLIVALVCLKWSEGASALAAIVGVGVYYVVLWLLRRKIEHTIQFTITKS